MITHTQTSGEEWPDTVVARVPSVAIAEMLAGALIDEGIPARVTGADRAYPSMDWARGVQVRVPASRAQEAKAMIETEPDADPGPGPGSGFGSGSGPGPDSGPDPGSDADA